MEIRKIRGLENGPRPYRRMATLTGAAPRSGVNASSTVALRLRSGWTDARFDNERVLLKTYRTRKGRFNAVGAPDV